MPITLVGTETGAIAVGAGAIRARATLKTSCISDSIKIMRLLADLILHIIDYQFFGAVLWSCMILMRLRLQIKMLMRLRLRQFPLRLLLLPFHV
jgi:hypothetical protein